MAGSSSATTTERDEELGEDILVDRIRVREGWKVKSHVHVPTHGLDEQRTWSKSAPRPHTFNQATGVTNNGRIRTFPTKIQSRSFTLIP